MTQVLDEAVLTTGQKDILLEIEKVNQVFNARRKLRGMSFYVPNPVQFNAHKSEARIIVVCAGNRSGKSTFGGWIKSIISNLCYYFWSHYHLHQF